MDELLIRFIQERPQEAAQMMEAAFHDQNLTDSSRDMARLGHAYLTDSAFREAFIDHIAGLIENPTT